MSDPTTVQATTKHPASKAALPKWIDPAEIQDSHEIKGVYHFPIEGDRLKITAQKYVERWMVTLNALNEDLETGCWSLLGYAVHTKSEWTYNTVIPSEITRRHGELKGCVEQMVRDRNEFLKTHSRGGSKR